MNLGLIWAQSLDRVIGANGRLPWYLPEDLRHFREITHRSPVIMGRKTWDSLPERFRPLPGRSNIVVTRNPEWSAPGTEPALTISSALTRAELSFFDSKNDSWIWVIGGAELFTVMLPLAARVELTEVKLAVPGDCYAPKLADEWQLSRSNPENGFLESATGISYRFLSYTRAVESGATLRT